MRRIPIHRSVSLVRGGVPWVVGFTSVVTFVSYHPTCCFSWVVIYLHAGEQYGERERERGLRESEIEPTLCMQRLPYVLPESSFSWCTI